MQHVMNGAILRPTIANASDMVSTNYSLASAAPLSPLVPSIQSILRGAGATRHAISMSQIRQLCARLEYYSDPHCPRYFQLCPALL